MTHDLSPDSNSILIIEDNLDHQLMIRRAIESRLPSVELVFFLTQAEGFNLIEEQCQTQETLPRFIILNLYTPEREDSLYFLRSIRQQLAPVCWLPVVILSASSLLEDLEACFEQGATAYLTKPLSPLLLYPLQWTEFLDTLEDFWFVTKRIKHRKELLN